jgi:hypothetical protein
MGRRLKAEEGGEGTDTNATLKRLIQSAGNAEGAAADVREGSASPVRPRHERRMATAATCGVR